MAKKRSPYLKPTNVRKTRWDSKELVDVWYYESAKGIEIYHRRRDGKQTPFGPIIRIPWTQLLRSAKRSSRSRRSLEESK